MWTTYSLESSSHVRFSCATATRNAPPSSAHQAPRRRHSHSFIAHSSLCGRCSSSARHPHACCHSLHQHQTTITSPLPASTPVELIFRTLDTESYCGAPPPLGRRRPNVTHNRHSFKLPLSPRPLALPTQSTHPYEIISPLFPYPNPLRLRLTATFLTSLRLTCCHPCVSHG